MTAFAPMQLNVVNIITVSQDPVISKETGEPNTSKPITRGDMLTKRISTGVKTMTPINTLKRSRLGAGRWLIIPRILQFPCAFVNKMDVL
jgi:hypothetical protein